jgi:hypothetical protein
VLRIPGAYPANNANKIGHFLTWLLPRKRHWEAHGKQDAQGLWTVETLGAGDAHGPTTAEINVFGFHRTQLRSNRHRSPTTDGRKRRKAGRRHSDRDTEISRRPVARQISVGAGPRRGAPGARSGPATCARFSHRSVGAKSQKIGRVNTNLWRSIAILLGIR